MTAVAALTRMHIQSWRETYAGILPGHFLRRLSQRSREALWQQILSEVSSRRRTLVAVNEKGSIVGFANAGPAFDLEGYEAELFAIYILREYQGLGIGTQLVREITQWLLSKRMDSMRLWVVARNPSRGFYETLGGKLIDRAYMNFGDAKRLILGYGWKDIRPLAELAYVDKRKRPVTPAA